MENKKIQMVMMLIVGIALGIIVRQIFQTAHYKKVEGYEVIGRITVVEEYINIRVQPTTNGGKLSQVLEGEKYDVIEVFEEDGGSYIWYKIVFGDRRVGWVASDSNSPWVVYK